MFIIKKCLISIVLIFSILTGCGIPNTAREEKSFDITKDYSDKAVSGVWISYSEVNSMLLSERGFELEFADVINNCRELNINEIYIHIRAFCDSLFKSSYFPLIKAAENYDFDIFEYIITECHKADIKVHAWINPYRVQTSSNDIETLNSENPAYKWVKDGKAINVLTSNSGIYLNPAENDVRELVLDGIREVLENYEVDGIHFDDYFYPTADLDFDSQSYKIYTENTENPLPLENWRRSNVNSLISSAYTAVKFFDKDILFTVSPAAQIDKNYNELFADVESWIKSGCVDRIIPQIYFGFDYPVAEFTFENLFKSWKELASVNKNVELMIGLATYKIGTDAEPDREEWNSRDDIIARQARICFEDKDIAGYILFSYSSLVSDQELNGNQRKNFKNFIDGCK